MSTEIIESLEQQLCTLYAEREQLQDRYGVSSADDIVQMVSCLEEQLKYFYGRYGSVDTGDDVDVNQLLSQLKSLGDSLDTMYSRKTVDFSFENSRPVVKAQWIEDLKHGDDA